MVFVTLRSKWDKRAGMVAKSATSKTTATGGVAAVLLPVKAKSTAKTPIVFDPALKKKKLIEIVTERSGVKKKDAKPVIEAMFAVLGQTLRKAAK